MTGGPYDDLQIWCLVARTEMWSSWTTGQLLTLCPNTVTQNMRFQNNVILFNVKHYGSTVKKTTTTTKTVKTMNVCSMLPYHNTECINCKKFLINLIMKDFNMQFTEILYDINDLQIAWVIKRYLHRVISCLNATSNLIHIFKLLNVSQ